MPQSNLQTQPQIHQDSALHVSLKSAPPHPLQKNKEKIKNILKEKDVFVAQNNLPIYHYVSELVAAVKKYPVLIIAGATGSGKSTQLPKIMLQAGLGQKKGQKIAHTQPRRIAVLSIAKRLNQELHEASADLDHLVAYQMRFQQSSEQENTAIKVMTDGILLAEIAHDRYLRKYDCIIIDEAHERSLNIDFLLGYLKKILPKRPDLKLIITSATIDTERFSKHFNGAPIFNIPGKTFPIEVCYTQISKSPQSPQIPTNQSPENNTERVENLPNQILQAIHSLPTRGDILVFLPGEYEIKQSHDLLKKELRHHQILPLYSRLSMNAQEQIFKPDTTSQRIILATNVAETSITVPNIYFVIDSGLAKVKRYSYRQKIEQLQIEKISQASANQRMGRCGRIAEGLCIRLYDEADFNNRAEHTTPEILRSNLAGVILKMYALGLGDIEAFPFLEMPTPRAIQDAKQSLVELQALDLKEGEGKHHLSEIGRQMMPWNIDVNMARMLLQAKKLACVYEVMVIVAALSIQDPREYPQEAQEAARQAHQKFKHPDSEFLSIYKLWLAFETANSEKTSNKALKDWCIKHFISYLRMREWRELFAQLLRTARDQEWVINQPCTLENLDASYHIIHQALLSGLLSKVGCWQHDKKEYLGVRQIKFLPHRQSIFYKKKANWIMAQDLQETQKIYARTVAKIEPEWLIYQAKHLLKKQIGDAFWSREQGQAMCHEQGLLYGLAVYQKKLINYQKIDEKISRNLLLKALVENDLKEHEEKRLPFLQHNQKLLIKVEKLENRLRQNTLLIDDEVLQNLYDQRIPTHIFSTHHLIVWYQGLKKSTDHSKNLKNLKCPLSFTEEDITSQPSGQIIEQFPNQIEENGQKFRLSYHFEPGHYWDGVTLNIQLWQLPFINQNRCDWLVPGMLREKLMCLIKGLPQRYRKQCVPVNQYVENLIETHHLLTENFAKNDLIHYIIDDFKIKNAQKNLYIQKNDFNVSQLPAHLSMNFKVVDQDGIYLDSGKDLFILQQKWQQAAQNAFAEQIKPLFNKGLQELQVGLENLQNLHEDKGMDQETDASIKSEKSKHLKNIHNQTNQINQSNNLPNIKKNHDASHMIGDKITDWSFGILPELLEIQKNKQLILGYPALVDQQDYCVVDVFQQDWQASQFHIKGIRRLIALNIKSHIKQLEKNIDKELKLGLDCQKYLPHYPWEQIKDDLMNITIDRCFLLPEGNALSFNLPKNKAEFEVLLQQKGNFLLIANQMLELLHKIINVVQNFEKRFKNLKAMGLEAAHQDISEQLQFLTGKYFLIQHPYFYLKEFPRFLQAILLRLEKIHTHIEQDQSEQKKIQELKNAWFKLYEKQTPKLDLLNLSQFSNWQPLLEYRYALEELRVAIFANSLKTRQIISYKRLQKQLFEMAG